ncbi:hypothetical protein FXO38_30390 [Capsicum annuum]|nr:hypothetical protein FXO37_35388 [Capsicum annuum]KAF3624191.1 hypothetical protein FXO38_30390 [Capsicum annuum]
MKKNQCVVQAQLCRCVMTLEVKGSSSSGILIRANDTSLSFTPGEFSIITGLNCVSNSERYKDFLWRSLSFEDLVRSLNNRLKADGKFYLIHEMPLAIQVWLYECCSNVPSKIAAKKDVPEDEHSADSDVGFQDPPPKKINEHSKKKQKGCTDLHPDKTNVEIDSQYLIPNELLQSINLDYNLSEKIVHHDVLIIDEKMDGTNLFDSQFTTPNELLPSLNTYRRESNMTQPSTTREEEPSDEHFNDKKSESIVNIIASSKSIIVHPSRELQIPVQKIWIRRPSKFKESPYTMKFGLAAKRCILLYDSYESSGHYPIVLAEIKKLSTIIPLCLQQCDFYVKKGIQVENHPRYKDSSDMFDVLFQENLPQQLWEILDCGVYLLTYAECLSYGHKVLANEFDPNALRIRYAALLWDYGTRKQDANAHSDVEAPVRFARQSRITSVTEVFDV